MNSSTKHDAALCQKIGGSKYSRDEISGATYIVNVINLLPHQMAVQLLLPR